MLAIKIEWISFYESNPGLSSRVANHVDFPDYSPDELLHIGKMMLEEQQYRLTPESETVLIRLHYSKNDKSSISLMLEVFVMQ